MIASARASNVSLGVGVAGVVACAIGVATSGADAFFHAYLVAALLFTEVAFGCLTVLLLHTLTGGGWGLMARRPLFSGASTMPLCALLMVPVALGAKSIYPWARPEVVAHDELLQHKAAYLNLPFFVGRGVFYFALWSALALFLYRRAKRRGERTAPSRAMRMVSGPGLLAAGLTMTFAAIDWLMSLDPKWSSTLLGLIVIVGSVLAGLAFSIVVVTSSSEGAEEDRRQSLHDLGNLLLVFVMVWAYFSFSQYLIMYAGNMAEEVPFYLQRSSGGWQQISLAIIALHFAVPFVVLLSRRTKRSPRALRVVALGVLVMRLVELFWFVAPNFKGADLGVGLLDVAAPLAVGGLWMFWFTRRVRSFDVATKRPVVAAP